MYSTRHLIALCLLASGVAGSARDEEESAVVAGKFYPVFIHRHANQPPLFLCLHTAASAHAVGPRETESREAAARKAAEDDDGAQRITEIVLLGPDRLQVLQRIRPDARFDARDVYYGDYNWDGCRDFRIYDRVASGRGLQRHAHYLFDPLTQRYLPSAELNALSAVLFDDENKTVLSLPRPGGDDRALMTYQWRDGHLWLTREVTHGYGADEHFFTQFRDRQPDGSLRTRRFDHE